MGLTILDWSIVILYFAITLYIGVRYKVSTEKGQGLNSFFLSGRNLVWWAAGTSMVASTFAADTPLAIVSIIAKDGLAGNWYWWAAAFSGMIVAFVYARMWRRSEVITDSEIIEVRYSGKPAAFLRGYRAIFYGFFFSAIVIGWVTSAMLNVLQHTVLAGTNASDLQWLIIIGLLGITAIYSTLAGLKGVVMTDIFQFVVAMGGCIAIAIIAVNHLGGIFEVQSQLTEIYGSAQIYDMMPSFGEDSLLPLDIFLILILIRWWASSSPGDEPGGGGYQLQRLLSTKSENEAIKAAVWFNVANYCIRPWPWFIAAFAALILFPEVREMGLDRVGNPGIGYPMLIKELAPSGLYGLMLVVFFAAYMSTISSLINWGASFLVNDLYKRFVNTDADEKHYVSAARSATIAILFFGAFCAYLLQDIPVDEVWKLMAALSAGTGPVFLLRWFWWRINAYSEISAMASSLITTLILSATLDLRTEYVILISCLVTSVVWVTVTLLTKPEPERLLTKFYRKIRPGGIGWGPIAASNTDVDIDKNVTLSLVVAMIAALGVFFALGMIKFLIFFNPMWIAITGLASFGSFAFVFYVLNKRLIPEQRDEPILDKSNA